MRQPTDKDIRTLAFFEVRERMKQMTSVIESSLLHYAQLDGEPVADREISACLTAGWLADRYGEWEITPEGTLQLGDALRQRLQPRTGQQIEPDPRLAALHAAAKVLHAISIAAQARDLLAKSVHLRIDGLQPKLEALLKTDEEIGSAASRAVTAAIELLAAHGFPGCTVIEFNAAGEIIGRTPPDGGQSR